MRFFEEVLAFLLAFEVFGWGEGIVVGLVELS